jgi:hypothetical protein
MRKSSLLQSAVLILLGALPALTLGCGHEESSEDDKAEANRLLADVQSRPYQNFQRAPGWETSRRTGTTAHHGRFLDVYMNDVLASAVSSGASAPWPLGSLLVKDGWTDPEGKQKFQTAILRKEATGVWFGAEFSSSGEVLEAGRNFEECNGCHGGGKDYLLAF